MAQPIHPLPLSVLLQDVTVTTEMQLRWEKDRRIISRNSMIQYSNIT